MSSRRKLICVIRHGRTALNAQKVFRGHLDSPLDDRGEQQAELTGKLLADIDLNVIYTSPLQRAVQTAEAVSKYQKNVVKVVPHQGFMDLSYGQWEGKTYDEVKQEYPELHKIWEEDPKKVVIPEAETLTEARNRIWPALEQILAENNNPIIAIVSHRVVNKLILISMLGLTESDFWKLQQDTCCVNLIEYKGGQFTVLKMNHSSHIFSLQESINIGDF